jgi:hypothetical protein
MFKLTLSLLILLPVLVYSFTHAKIEFIYNEQEVDVMRFMVYYSIAQASIFFLTLFLAVFSTLLWSVTLIGLFKVMEWVIVR